MTEQFNLWSIINKNVMDEILLLKLNRTVWVSLLEQGKILEAISYFESYHNSLLILLKEKKFKEQISYELTYSQDYFLTKMKNIAQKFFNGGDYVNASICYTSIFKFDGNDIDSLRNYIECLDYMQQYDLELDLVNYLQKMKSEDKEICKLLSDIYNKKNDIANTIKYYEKYLHYKTDITANEYNQLGCFYNLLYANEDSTYENIIKSLENFEKACQKEPYNVLFHKNVTIMAAKANNWETCKKHWQVLLDMDKMTNDDKYDYAAFCLRTGDFDGWHKYFDSRFEKEHNKTPYPKLSKPKWDGIKDISNSTLLIYQEQGFGDTFLMWGYVQRLLPLAKHLIIVVQDAVYDLLKDNEWGIEVVPNAMANLKKMKFDYHIPFMSIPIALKMNRDNISVGEGYIKPDTNVKEYFREKYFKNNKFKIGISFAGNSSGNKTRDIPIEYFLPLDRLSDIAIYCFTKGVDDSTFDCFKNNKVINIAREFTTFSDTAAAMANLDVMLTSDNCILNLAGAIGLKTFGLFNWHYEFRWFDLSGDNTVWLTSVKPFVNDKINNWSYSIGNATEEIRRLKEKTPHA